jgi:hypothetical protein
MEFLQSPFSSGITYREYYVNSIRISLDDLPRVFVSRCLIKYIDNFPISYYIVYYID